MNLEVCSGTVFVGLCGKKKKEKRMIGDGMCS